MLYIKVHLCRESGIVDAVYKIQARSRESPMSTNLNWEHVIFGVLGKELFTPIALLTISTQLMHL